MLKEVKPRNARAARALAKREPQLVEGPKQVLFLRATTSSAFLNAITQNLHALVQPHAIRFTKKNAIHPFEDASSLEFFSEKNDAALLCLSSHSKKRPHCLTFARTFDAKILDMLECHVNADTGRVLDQFRGRKWRVGTKPMMCFSGPQFEDLGSGSSSNNKFALAKSMFSDLFRGEEVTEMDIEGLEMMISFAAGETGEGEVHADWVYMRVWRIITKRSGQKMPRVELEEMGPRIDFRLGRVQQADPAVMKEALKKDKTTKPKQKKNVDVDPVGDKIGRIHLGKQNLSDLQTRKMKGLKRTGIDEDLVGSQDVIEGADGGVPKVKRRKKISTEA